MDEKETKCGVCPACGEPANIKFNNIDLMDKTCYKRYHCQKCNTHFDDIYKFTGQRIVEK